MSRIVLATLGSFGDLHPMIALGLELRRRGHDVVISSFEGFREKIDALGFEFHPLRPNVDPEDRAMTEAMMHPQKGPEQVIRHLIFPALQDMYEDLRSACSGADLLLNGEIVYVAGSLAEKTGIKWISTTLSPMLMFSAHDPNVYHIAPWLEVLRPLPAAFHAAAFALMKSTISHWMGPVKKFRRSLGLSEDVDPVFKDKYSPLLHLAMFSRTIGPPQPDWHQPTVQTGCCFYDESDTVSLDPEMREFLDAGEPPIIFTLGSAAVLHAGDFFDESVKTAKRLGRRAIFVYGMENPPPAGMDETMAAFQFAPYSLVFPHGSCIVHQGGIGTTHQALKAGVPQVVVPFSHDQPDNAARCRRAGVAERVSRADYNAETAFRALDKVLSNESYRTRARELKNIVDSEGGTAAACDAIETTLRK